MADKEAFEILTRHSDDIYRCFRCGLCRDVCPSFEESGLEYSSPRGRVQFARAVLEGIIPPDRVFEDRILDCLNCMRCAEICPSGVRTDRIVLAARAELAKRGKLTLIKKFVFNGIIKNSFVMRLCAMAGSLGQKWFYEPGSALDNLVPFAAGLEDKKIPRFTDRPAINRWPEINPSVYGEKTMTAGYFIGCATNFLFPQVADATIRVLTRNRIEVVIPRGQVCCGVPVYSSGDFTNARKLAEKNLEVFRDFDIDCIVTDCSSCSAALKHDIRELLDVKSFDVPVYDINEYLVNILSIDRDFGEVPMSVTYHDPCHLKRGQNIFLEPRELLKMVPGVTLLEMEDSDMCCGGAGTFSFTHHELSRKIGARKIETIRNTGAEYAATPCPSCKIQIDDLLYHAGIDIKTIHPVEVLDFSYKQKDRIDSEFELIEV